jgi:RNA polymerase sigma factor for flagellar operon FliA
LTAPARPGDADVMTDDEAESWRALRRGDLDARQALFARYEEFARATAARHFRSRTGGDLDLHEFRQLAYAGLLEAIDRFDPERGVPFRGYATRRITGSVLDGLAHASELREQMAFRNRLRAERVRSLADAELDQLSSSEAMRALAEIATGLAIGFLLDSGLVVSEEAVDRAPSAYDGLVWKETVRGLHDAIEDLPEREQLIVRQHYLHGVAFELIADLLGVSKSRVSQLHKDAIGRLRRRLSARPNFVLER